MTRDDLDRDPMLDPDDALEAKLRLGVMASAILDHAHILSTDTSLLALSEAGSVLKGYAEDFQKLAAAMEVLERRSVERHQVEVAADGYIWNGQKHGSLSKVVDQKTFDTVQALLRHRSARWRSRVLDIERAPLSSIARASLIHMVRRQFLVSASERTKWGAGADSKVSAGQSGLSAGRSGQGGEHGDGFGGLGV